MATPAPASPTPSQPPVEILYAVPIGTVISWYPSPANLQTKSGDPGSSKTIVYPPGFALCDGSTVEDAASPFNGTALPNLVNRFILGAGGNIDYGQTGGYDATTGWTNTPFITEPTQADSSDDEYNVIIQNGNPSSSWRYTLTQDDLTKNDGNHHHAVAADMFVVPPPAFVALIPLIRIK